MFHQLHCLEMLKDRMTIIYRGGEMESHGAGHEHIVPRMMMGDDEEGSEEDVAVKHLFHCLDYVAQVSFVVWILEEGLDTDFGG